MPFDLSNGGSFALVAANEPARPIAVALRSWEASNLWELAPRTGLAPGVSYEVWGVPRDKKKPPSLLGVFRTTDADDVTPPTAPALTSAEQRASMTSCPTIITVQGTPSMDASGEVFYAVWLSNAEGRLAYDATPAAIVRWSRPSSYERAPALEIIASFPRGAGAFRVGVRAMDVAGNLSAPAEIPVKVY
jgi:hypothetical protein